MSCCVIMHACLIAFQCCLLQTRIVERAKQIANNGPDSEQGTFDWGEYVATVHRLPFNISHNILNALEVLSVAPMLAGKTAEQNLGKDFETLMGMLRPEEAVNKEDIKKMKDQVFGPNVFWVTETRATDDILEGGILVGLKCFVLCCV